MMRKELWADFVGEPVGEYRYQIDVRRMPAMPTPTGSGLGSRLASCPGRSGPAASGGLRPSAHNCPPVGTRE